MKPSWTGTHPDGNAGAPVKLILWPVAIVLAAALSGVVARGASAQEVPSPELLQTVAEKLNEHTPMMVDGETELTSIGVGPGAIVYQYRLINVDASAVPPDQLRAAAQPAVANRACTKAETRRDFLDRGIVMRYSYYDRNRQFITAFDVTVADCQAR
jgi:hypothetical protein